MTVSIVRSTFVNNTTALSVSDNIVASIVDSEFKANFWGIKAGAEDIAGSPTSASVTCTRCNFNDHGAVAIQVSRAQNSVVTVNLVSSQLTGRKGLAQSALTADTGTVIYVTDSLISQWTQGVNSFGGEIISLGDNRVYDNDLPGAGFTSTIGKQ